MRKKASAEDNLLQNPPAVICDESTSFCCKIGFPKQSALTMRELSLPAEIDVRPQPWVTVFQDNPAKEKDIHTPFVIHEIGGPRDMRRRYMDAIALVQYFGKPNLFVTMTCNSSWPEIKEHLMFVDEVQNRPDLFVPGSMSQVLITSSDSRIRVVDGADLFHNHAPAFGRLASGSAEADSPERDGSLFTGHGSRLILELFWRLLLVAGGEGTGRWWLVRRKGKKSGAKAIIGFFGGAGSWPVDGWAFIRGKGLLGILDCLKAIPTEDKEKEAWEANNGKIITFLVNSVSIDIAIELTSFEKASEMWSHPHTLGSQTSMENSLFVDTAIAAYTSSSSSGNSNKPVQRYYCKETGHIISYYKKQNYCNYCKKDGHIILECRKKPGSVKCSNPHKAFQAMTWDVGTQHTLETKTQMTPQLFYRNDIYKIIQDLLAASLPNAISTALTTTYPGKNKILNSTVWHIDFAASNHMTKNQKLFSDLSKTRSTHEIVTGNGHVLSASGKIGSSRIQAGVWNRLRINLCSSSQDDDCTDIACFSINKKLEVTPTGRQECFPIWGLARSDLHESMLGYKYSKSKSVQVLRQFITKPYKIYYSALLRVIRYIKGIVDRSLLFLSSSLLDIVGYTDVNWQDTPIQDDLLQAGA
ncbi:hypothetical protein FXO38_08804 [Capsicum annuum]|nr:hypothetical protein FXO38_08804 [Capsicum annuum]